jgi:hypothetical protein
MPELHPGRALVFSSQASSAVGLPVSTAILI